VEQIGPYRVLEEIARGGMGVVYRAQDAEGREVALKLLLASRSNNPVALRRFEQEAKTLARLRHAHVVQVLAAGEQQGTPWLALEFVSGESLEERLTRGPLPVWEAIRLTAQLARALSYVHGCGVLHRDLKPANVLLRGDQALLTDFGLSRDEGPESRSRITASGAFLGTPGYWAPEQAQGDLEAFGPRTDVYGLGGVLFACLTGRPPVEADNPMGYFGAAFRTEAPSARALRAEVPEWLDALCQRCLAPNPDERPESADEVARCLLLAEAGQAGAGFPGWGWAVIAAGALTLGALGWLALGGRASPIELKPTEPVEPPPPAEAPKNPEFALRDGEAFRLRGEHATAVEAFTRALELDPGLAPAYRGRALARFELGEEQEGLADLERALALAPDDPQLHVERGVLCGRLGRAAEARAEFERALALDPDHTEALVNRGRALLMEGDAPGALRHYEAALARDPNCALAYASRGVLAWRLSQDREAALADLGRALILDPSSAYARSNRGAIYSLEGRAADAIADFDVALEQRPRDAGSLVSRGSAFIQLGERRAALADFEAAHAISPGLENVLLNIGVCHDELGNYEQALAAYEEALERRTVSSLGDVYYNRGTTYTRLKRHEEAVADFTRSLEIDPSRADVRVNRALANLELGRLEACLQDCDAALAGDLSMEQARIVQGTRGEAQRRLEAR